MATITSPRIESPAGQITSPSAPSSPSLTGTETPTSSVRPSIDLSRNDSKPTSGPAQRRNRAALRDYYKLKSQPKPSSDLSRTASITSNASDSTITSTLNNDTSPLLSKLDDPSFEADKFISSLLASATLRDILRTESALVSEIRNLDGERKALVYDNYSKLIKAVGTIGQMQRGMQKGEGGLDGVEKLEKKLMGLQVVVEELGTEKGEDQNEERKKLKKQKEVVKWVLGAPSRLQRFCEEGKREYAELEWAKVKQVLDRWEGVKGVDEVRMGCAEAMKTQRRSEDG